MSDNIVFFNSPDLPDIIELRNIRQTYPGKRGGEETVVIDGLDLLIEDKPNQGQFVVLMGLSGCGKSTLLRYIAGLQKPTAGEVLLRGNARKSDDVVGMVFQQYSSFEWMTVLENVMLPLELKGVPLRERRDRAMQMITEVGLAGHEHKFAQAPGLSGGQLQRVAIARSLIAEPNIILMDEPFGALDTLTRYQMQLLLAKLWEARQSTIVLVTHDVSEAVFLADDIYVMAPNPGRIIRHIHIDLPFHRDLATIRSTHFANLANEVKSSVFFSAPDNGALK